MYFDLWFFMTIWSWYHLWSQVESILVFNAQMVSFWLWQIKYIKTILENFSWSVIHFQSLFTVEDASCSRKQEPRLTRVSEECSKVGADGRTDGIINVLDNIKYHSRKIVIINIFSDLSQLIRVSIGWQINENFIE